jgi:hypothetical protein
MKYIREPADFVMRKNSYF